MKMKQLLINSIVSMLMLTILPILMEVQGTPMTNLNGRLVKRAPEPYPAGGGGGGGAIIFPPTSTCPPGCVWDPDREKCVELFTDKENNKNIDCTI